MKAEIVRVESGRDGTFGVLLLDGMVFCVTLELPWRGNAQGVSSIPAGRYLCQRTASPLVARITDGKWDETFEVSGVPGRSRILFHSGNTVVDSRGCILVASSYGKLRENRGILNSGATFDLFMTALRNVNAFGLTVRDVNPYSAAEA